MDNCIWQPVESSYRMVQSFFISYTDEQGHLKMIKVFTKNKVYEELLWKKNQMNSLISLLIINILSQNIFAFDIWNDVPCNKYFEPEGCDFESLEGVSVDEFDHCAPAKLPVSYRNYYLGAAGRKQTYNENKRAFRRINILPKPFRDISKNTLKTEILGYLKTDFPIGLSPVAIQKLAHPEGELATVTGISDMEVIMILSSYASTSLEEVAKRAKGTKVHLWMQTYIFKNLTITKEIVRKAEKYGFKGIVVTADGNIDSTLTCNGRGFQLPKGVGLPNLGDEDIYYNEIVSPSATFASVGFLRKLTKLPIFVKGILTVPDARSAMIAGATGIIVSNHGGRQLDGDPATIDALPAIVDTVNRLFPNREVYMDGGVRSGQDVYKAMARGAKMVFVGRPIIWGLALNGSDGVKQMMVTLKNQFNETMLLSGQTKPSQIKRNSLIPQLPIFSYGAPENDDDL